MRTSLAKHRPEYTLLSIVSIFTLARLTPPQVTNYSQNADFPSTLYSSLFRILTRRLHDLRPSSFYFLVCGNSALPRWNSQSRSRSSVGRKFENCFWGCLKTLVWKDVAWFVKYFSFHNIWNECCRIIYFKIISSSLVFARLFDIVVNGQYTLVS